MPPQMEATKKSWPIFACVAALAAGSVAAEESQRRTPVYLDSTARDIHGKRFVYHIRELLRDSKGMSLAQSEDEALYQLRILVLDNDPSGIVYSVVWTMRAAKDGWAPSYVTQSAGLCGRDVLENCAQTVIAATDEQIQDDAKVWAEIAKDLIEAKKAAPKE